MSDDEKPVPVGQGSSPVEHRFGPLRIGNRHGRPKGTPNVKTIVRRIAREKHKVMEGGRPRRLTTVELLLRLQRNKAMTGNIQAERYLDRWRDRLSPSSDETGYLLAPEDVPLEEFIRRQERLNTLRRPPKGYGPSEPD